MGDVKNLRNKDAIMKIKELAEWTDVCMFCTSGKDSKMQSRPMSTQQVDEQWRIWFMSRKTSNKNKEIEKNDSVSLLYADNGKYHYLAIEWTASIVTDKAKIEELADGIEKAWFPEGKDDPELTLICVEPEDGHYWDSKYGKVVSMLKAWAAAISWNEADLWVEWDLGV